MTRYVRHKHDNGRRFKVLAEHGDYLWLKDDGVPFTSSFAGDWEDVPEFEPGQEFDTRVGHVVIDAVYDDGWIRYAYRNRRGNVAWITGIRTVDDFRARFVQ